MTQSSALQVFKGGWEELENAVFTENQNTFDTIPKSSFIRPDGTQLFTLQSTLVETRPLSVPWDVDFSPPTTSLIEQAIGTPTGMTGLRFSSDGTKMFIVGEGNDRIIQYGLSAPDFNITSPSLDETFIVSDDTSPKGIAFSPDGTNLYLAGAANNTIFQYPLSIAFDISPSSIGASTSLDLTGIATAIRDVDISSDGTKLFILSNAAPDELVQVPLDVPFDVTSNSTPIETFSLAAQDVLVRGIAFSSDGTKLFMIGITNDKIYEYILSTPFDISDTPIFVGEFDVSGQSSNPSGVAFNNNGSRMYITGRNENKVFQFSLTNNFDITGITKTFTITDDSTPTGLFFRDDGTKMFIVGENTKTLYEYVIPIPWDISSIIASPSTFPLTLVVGTVKQCAFSRDGDFVFITDNSTVSSFFLSTSWDITSAGSFTSFNPGTQVESVAFKPQGDKMYIGNIALSEVREFDLPSPFTIVGATDTGNVLNLSGVSNPSDLFWRGTGNQFFTLDSITDEIRKFELDLSWNISTASYFGNLTTGGNERRAVNWRPDGLLMFVLDSTANNVRAFSTTRPFNISDLTVIANPLDVNPQETDAQGMWWKNDGTRLYVIGFTSETVFQYNTSVPWSVDPANMIFSGTSFDPNIAFNPSGITFSPDGLKMYIVSNIPDTVRQWDLATPYTLPSFGTAPDKTVDLDPDPIEPRDIVLKPDGTQVYFVSSTPNDDALRYSFITPFDISTISLQDTFVTTRGLPANPQGLFIRQNDGKKLFVSDILQDAIPAFDMSLEFNNSIITNLGDELITDTGDRLVYA